MLILERLFKYTHKSVSNTIVKFNMNHRMIITKVQGSGTLWCVYHKTKTSTPQGPETHIKRALTMQQTLILGGI